MFSRMGSAAFRKDLTNTIRLCSFLGNPEKKFRSIHVAGTNGKGSVSHMLAAVLQTHGKKTGLYTSPHLYDFRERIKVDGVLADEEFVVDFVERMKGLIEEIHPSFFEITVAMAFEYFAQQQVDIAVIEVGLGGRLDSTNVILPELSVITNIGWDHMNLLGDSLEAIAGEKAGIIKKNIPAVIGEAIPETLPVFIKAAEEKQSTLLITADRFTVTRELLQENKISVEILDKKTGSSAFYESDLPGIYQTRNIPTVLQALRALPGFEWNEVQVKKGIATAGKTTGLHGRWEVIGKDPLTVLEVAHNPDGVQQMLLHIGKLRFSRLHLVLGFVKDKDVTAVLEILPASAEYYFTQAAIPRALDAGELKNLASTFGLKGNEYSNVNEALEAARSLGSKEDLVIVCGSIFLVAEVDRPSI
jgi:dihydrofolate synthase/folylpolyglutamate synthase